MTTHRPETPAGSATHEFRRTSTRMADDRELIYFDDTEPWLSGSRARDAVDHRPLPNADDVVRGGSQLRYDPLTGDWIAMASHRNDRTLMPPPDEDPLAPTRPGKFPTEIADDSYDVVVFENRFPSFSPRVGGEDTLVDGESLFPVRPATGRCEVICFSSEPAGSFGGLDPRRARTVVEAWVDRTRELSALDGVEQVFCFENRGAEIGVTLPHPHGQIYAYPYVTPKTRQMLRRAVEHREATGGNLFRDVVAAELRAGTRVVARSQHWVAYVPAAARWPVELHLAPLRDDVRDLPGLTEEEKADLVAIYLDLLGRLDRYYPDEHPLPYISGWHQAPSRSADTAGNSSDGREEFRLHLQLFSVLRGPGKVKYLAGSESGMAAWINDTTPERVADRLREVAP